MASKGYYRGLEVEDGRMVACSAEDMSEIDRLAIICLGFIRFCPLGGFAYRDGASNSSPRTAADFGVKPRDVDRAPRRCSLLGHRMVCVSVDISSAKFVTGCVYRFGQVESAQAGFGHANQRVRESPAWARFGAERFAHWGRKVRLTLVATKVRLYGVVRLFMGSAKVRGSSQGDAVIDKAQEEEDEETEDIEETEAEPDDEDAHVITREDDLDIRNNLSRKHDEQIPGDCLSVETPPTTSKHMCLMGKQGNICIFGPAVGLLSLGAHNPGSNPGR
ncbi:hypothetical protein E3N88_43212 [Mikania micrantha]|uniref:Uncharacterized protein n=1 Tax=Mikania micrantha TaxID=192012 RepID=A0A5N6LFN1_9ASTR|nr:hypothetical protein E3N88_43212 [Mikania micrantha]